MREGVVSALGGQRGASAASYRFFDAVVRSEARAGLSSALRSPRLLLCCRYIWSPPQEIAEKMESAGGPGEHALWGHARFFISRASNARCGEFPHAPILQSLSNFGDGAVA